ncbi:MAG TPA: helix-turn-helix transcriptional regulator, partial [Steroidobacteraceae bacterium]
LLDPLLEELGLTPRMVDVLALLFRGQSNKLIARELGISPFTVAGYVSVLLKKLEVTSRAQVPLRVQDLRELLFAWDSERRRQRPASKKQQ